MRDGLLKGDSVMAQAWKELINGSTDTESPGERRPTRDEEIDVSLEGMKKGW